MTKEYAYEQLAYWWQHGDGTNHSAMAFTLYAKSDSGNKARFRLAWPEYAEVYDEWNSSPNGEEFFKEKVPSQIMLPDCRCPQETWNDE